MPATPHPARPESATGDRPATTSAVPRRRISRRGTIAICLTGFLGLVFLTPQLVAWSPLRHDLPRIRLPGYPGKITVGSAWLWWWGSTELHDVQFDGVDGAPLLTSRLIREDHGIWARLVRPDDPVGVQVEQPAVTLHLRSDGSNVEDALTPVFKHPKQRRRARTFEIFDATIHATDAQTGRTVEWNHIQAHGQLVPDGSRPSEVHLAAKLDDSSVADCLQLDVTYTSTPHGLPNAASPWNVAVRTNDLPVETLTPLLHRACPGLDLTGPVSADIRVGSEPAKSAGQPPHFSGAWQVKTSDLKTAWPRQPSDERTALGQTEFSGKLSLDGAVCLVETFDLKSPVCRLTGKGTFPVNHETASTSGDASQALANADFKLNGDINLVALCRTFPHLVPLRPGTEPTEGTVTIDVASRIEGGKSKWHGKLGTSKLEALVAGERIAWDQPLNFNVDFHLEPGQLAIDRLECESDLVQLTGRGGNDFLHLEAGCDLDHVGSRLGQFVDTSHRELHGKIGLVVDFKRESPDIWGAEVKGTIDNLLIRRQATTMVERRAGDIHPIERPPVVIPDRPPPILAPGRRGMQAQRRADRQMRREDRRIDREVRKQENEVVLVPVQEWQSLWEEPHFEITCRTRWLREKDALEIAEVAARSEGIRVQGSGSIDELTGARRLGLNGEVDYDLPRLLERVRNLVGPHVQIVGKDSRRFSISGSLRSPAATPDVHPLVPMGLAGSASVGWQSGDLFGLAAGPADLNFELAQAIVALQPTEVAVSGGKLNLAPRLLLDDGPPHVEIPAGRLVDGVALTEEACNTWLMFVAPILADATRTEGQFSIDLDETRLPLLDPLSGDLGGKLFVARGQVLPGPLLTELGEILGNFLPGEGGGPVRDWLGLDRPLVQFEKQAVDFELHGRRIHHSSLEFRVRNIVVRTRGSVGVDQTLDIIASISLSDEILKRSPFLSRLQGQVLEIPISGTLRRPRIDRSALGKLAQQFGPAAIEGIISQGVQKLLDRRNAP